MGWGLGERDAGRTWRGRRDDGGREWGGDRDAWVVGVVSVALPPGFIEGCVFSCGVSISHGLHNEMKLSETGGALRF